jgi:hypothetical protein
MYIKPHVHFVVIRYGMKRVKKEGCESLGNTSAPPDGDDGMELTSLRSLSPRMRYFSLR